MIKHANTVAVQAFGTGAALVCIAAGCSPAEKVVLNII